MPDLSFKARARPLGGADILLFHEVKAHASLLNYVLPFGSYLQARGLQN